MESSLYSVWQLLRLKLGFSAKKRAVFYEQLSALLASGIDLYRAANLMHDKYVKHASFFKSFGVEIKILKDMLYRLDAGLGTQSLAELFAGFIPKSESVILSVDSRGSIAALTHVIELLQSFNQLKSNVLKMMAMPLVSVAITIGLIIIVNHYIFPVLLGIFTLDQLPLATTSLYHFCHFFESHALILALIFIALVAAVTYSLGHWQGVGRKFADRLLPFNIYKAITSSAFLMSLSLLLAAGDDFYRAILKLKTHATHYLLSFLTLAEERIAAGDRPGEVLASIGLLNQDTQIYIEILDEAGVLSSSLQSMAKRSVDYQLKNISKLMGSLRVVLMLVVLGFSLWLYIAMFSIGMNDGGSSPMGGF